jgi:Ras-related protein Rab-2A
MRFRPLVSELSYDLRREVTYEDGEKFAKDNNLLFQEVSAKTAYKVEDIFIQNAEQILQKIENGLVDPSNEVLFLN